MFGTLPEGKLEEPVYLKRELKGEESVFTVSVTIVTIVKNKYFESTMAHWSKNRKKKTIS